MRRDFVRVAIVNRGEPAMRLIHAVRELAHQQGTKLTTIALYTEPDRGAMFVREADEALYLGPAHTERRDGSKVSAYLDPVRLERALVEAKADAAWAGWGFVAEHAEFVELCARLGVTFIGPSATSMRLLGDKIAAKRLAEAAGIPVLPWSNGPVASLADAREAANALGFPVFVKASAGGGGRGIRRAAGPHELDEAYLGAKLEAERSLTNATLYVEKAIDGVRHVEVQVAADHFGTIWTLGQRDCTLQRRHQKLLEESPARAIDGDSASALDRTARQLASIAGYESLGSFEFLYDPAAKSVHFLEANPRLQVEHAVTELVHGMDLVKLQLQIAQGLRLEGDPPRARGHAIEVRICAEDPDQGFAPTPGDLLLLRLPTGPGLRVDRGVTEGERIPPEFDSMIAKIIAHGGSRAEALARLRRALAESLVVVDGGTTNKAFLLELLAEDAVREDHVHTEWLEQSLASASAARRRPHGASALIQAAIEASDGEEKEDRRRFYASAARMRPEIRSEVGRTIELLHGGAPYTAQVFRTGPRAYTVELEGHRIEARVDPLGRFERWLTVGGRRYRTLSLVQPPDHLVEVDGVPHRLSRDDGGIVRATSPAVVVSVAAREGDELAEGAPIAVLEAMKMEMQLHAPMAGKVRRVFVNANAQVGPGDPLLQIEPSTSNGRDKSAPRVSLDELRLEAESAPKAAADRVRENLAGLRALALGYDVPASQAKRLIAEHQALAAEVDEGEVARAHEEDEILEIFSDLGSAFRRPSPGRDAHGAHAESPAHLATFLATLDPKAPGIPPRFLDRLRRALRHYGVSSLDRSEALEDALFRIYAAEQRFEANAPAIMALLERRLGLADGPGSEPSPRLLAILDHLVTVTAQRLPACHDLARDVRYRLFDQPIFEARRRVVYQDVEDRIRLLVSGGSLDRDEHVLALVDVPQPLEGLFADRFRDAGPLERTLLLEVLTRRHYRQRELHEPAVGTLPEQTWFSAVYDHEDLRIRVISTHSPLEKVTDAIEAMGRVMLAAEPVVNEVVLDLYTVATGTAPDPSVTVAELQAAIARAKLARRLRRIVVSVAYGPQAKTTQHFTFRPTAEGSYEEEKTYRGLHPMMAKRLELWRLENFEIERLRSAEDIYLFHAVARENPKDRRLFAFCEVRDTTPVKDEAGKIIAVPHFERMFHEAVAAIRHVQAKRPPEDRLYWNRIHMNVRGPLALTAEERFHLASKLGTTTEGLGIQKVTVRGRLVEPATGEVLDGVISIANPGGDGIAIKVSKASNDPIKPLSEYARKVVRMRERGLVYPYEIVAMLAPSSRSAESDLPAGTFTELDLDASGQLVKVDRPFGKNTSNIVTGLVTSFPPSHPDGMTRVIILGDASKDMGAIAEPECRRIMGALDLAHEMKVPVEWFALSAGAKISMESGTENMDWISRVLRKLIERTEEGLEVNVIVTGINVGAQPYWNAEATMLMHTRGILIMTEAGAMVLTGKTALDYSGSVSAADNFGIGGYDRIMGPNGQAQYFARNVHDACRILLAHYQHTYVVPGERFPRDLPTLDPKDRDVREHPLSGEDGLKSVGDVFSETTNPGRKKPFDIRSVMLAAIDRDHPPLERWAAMIDAETSVVWDAHLGGHAVCLLGIESRPLPRLGFVPNDGPERWTAGTLFPMSSKKIARAINSAGGTRPLVILANLSGFDGSPESMRKLQLEYGAEIGRAVVKFRGPIVFAVISRYHGGAFVVFSKALNERMEAVALEGTHASVIGGAPAAAVVFAREVDQRTAKDARLVELEKALAAASEPEKKRRLRAELVQLRRDVRSEKLGQVAEEFDHIHSVHRAKKVGSLDEIIAPARLRPYLVDAVERGMKRETGK